MITKGTHDYTTEQHTRATELWRRLLDTHVTTIYEQRRGYQFHLEAVTDEHLNALIITNGEEADDHYPVAITLVSYSDYGGSCLDAANVRYSTKRKPQESTSVPEYTAPNTHGSNWVSCLPTERTSQLGSTGFSPWRT
jgi:hypothetical protein